MVTQQATLQNSLYLALYTLLAGVCSNLAELEDTTKLSTSLRIDKILRHMITHNNYFLLGNIIGGALILIIQEGLKDRAA